MNRNDWKRVKKKGETYYVRNLGGKPIPGEAETIYDDDFKHGATLIFRSEHGINRGYYPCEMMSTRDQLERLSKKLRICPICEKEFKPITGDQVYCSHECYLAHRRELKRNHQRVYLGAEKTCAICGKKFRMNAPGQICCSPDCSKERFRIMAAEYRKRKKMKA